MKEWRQYCKSGKKPKDIPINLCQTYKKYWKGWGEFLGSGVIGVTKARDHYPTFRELREIIQQNNIKSTCQYQDFHRKTNLIIPYDIKRTYPNEFTTWDDFFNRQPKIFATPKEIMKYVKEHKIRSILHYRTLYKLQMLPDNFPYKPKIQITKRSKD